MTFIQFEDLQCPICRSYQEDGFSAIVQEYVRPGKVKLRFAGIPILGQDSEKALRYALAAGNQGKLWQYVAALYANQGAENSGWVTDELLEAARRRRRPRLDATQDGRGERGGHPAGADDPAEADRLGVPGTPTFFVKVGDGAPYAVQPNSFSIDAFRPIFADALSQ